MDKLRFTLLLFLLPTTLFATTIFNESFEYANHDMTVPIGWICDDNSWLCGYMEKDHNRQPHFGSWYAFTNADDSWMFMDFFTGSDLKYRYYLWGISDGEYDVEFWIGSGPSADEMTQLLFTKNVSSGTYEQFSEYVEHIAVDCRYFGIHATAHEGAYHLSIDDIMIDMVSRYDLDISPTELDTVMFPGTSLTFNYKIENTGFEDLYVYMNPHTQHFSDIAFTEDGLDNNSFPIVPGQIVNASCTATLDTDVAEGSRVYLDINFTVSCDCLTRLATIWVTVGDATGVNEHMPTVKLFPNPAIDHLTVRSDGLLRVEVRDVTGRTLVATDTNQDETMVDIKKLPAGTYFVTATTLSGTTTKKIVK